MENASLSTPISAPQFRGFRRASEISIASQVSGMADSYTASNIANKTKHHPNHCRGFSLLSQLALPHKSPTQTSFRRRRQHKHEIPAKARKLKGPRSRAAGCALRIPDLDIKTGILERSTPVGLLSHSIVTELHNKSLRFH